MATLFLIRGIPGSGKTTAANWLLASGIVDLIVAADDWFYRGGTYAFDPSQLAAAHGDCQRRVKEALAAGKNVAVHNTFTRLWEVMPYTGMNATEVVVLRMTRSFGSVHGVPEDRVAMMREAYEPFEGEMPFDDAFPGYGMAGRESGAGI